MADDMTMTVIMMTMMVMMMMVMMMMIMIMVMMSAAMCHPGQQSPLCGVQPDHTARAMSAAKRSNPDVAGGQPTGKMRLPLLC